MNIVFAEVAKIATTKVAIAVVTALLVIFTGRFAMKWVNKSVGKLHVEPTLYKFLMGVIKVVIYFFAIMIITESLGFKMDSLVALASVVSAAFALAASGVLSNIFGGLLLLITKPFAVNDYVLVCGQEGTVLELGILATKINTTDNKRITIPNSSISSATIVNYSTEGKRRVDLVFTASYDNKTEDVKRIIRSVAEAHEGVMDKEKIFVRVSSYNSSDISYTLRVWCKTADYWNVHFDLLEQVKAAYDENGIKMVYPYVNVIRTN